jgi:menaquinone-dependent protoporphyrinogen oxidase
MRVLVSAASRHGATLEIAKVIGDVLAERGLEVTVIPADQVSTVADWDAVVLGSGVYFGQWLKPATELTDRSAQLLTARPLWLFSSGPVGDPPKPARNPVDVSKMLTATQPRDHRLFGGAILRKHLDFTERAMTRALGVMDGDYRDWNEIRSWASGIANTLEAAPSSTAGQL